jgi:hypothetical protein
MERMKQYLHLKINVSPKKNKTLKYNELGLSFVHGNLKTYYRSDGVSLRGCKVGTTVQTKLKNEIFLTKTSNIFGHACNRKL